jgi:hypothetical protein
MIYWIIALIVWLIGIPVTYNMVTKKWDGQSKAGQIYFACIWPLLIPLYIIHYLYNKLRDKDGEI